jgi:glycosyltransferase involved in cell wall biosynthesis
MLNGLPHVKLVENGWQTWTQFRQTVRHMHLLMQPSYTESFNVVTADGVAEGVSSVVSDAIDWAPKGWRAPVDDANAMARVGRKLLESRWAPRQGLAALKRYNRKATHAWSEFLA